MDKQALFQKFVTFTSSVHQITNDMTKDVQAEDVTPLQYKILEYLAVCEPVTISSISDCLHMSLPNTSRELRKLIEKQLCEKAPDPEDRRKQYIRLTARGQVMMQAAFQQIQSQFWQRLASASDDELDEIERALDVLQKKVFY
ncbi:DNA-binding MarR family transcriptional regulator [Tumebacillus sp. BK434]|uniref:MarR family winged helix-turn-helix transcriptional regulator n=1 Tax=Tumebacillus sp. BK434 TaxID=2512169 RepID=UPI00104A7076|nr:MarR family transcriptional regulator [Tumebacillus sp. BK434]TCP52593.1 DNA-binding MarR family transcriptional regulator [Tumebacillus sp. BK434]